ITIPFLFTGALLLESFFGIPGLGSLTVEAIHGNDFSTLRTMVYLGALLFIAGQILTDISYALADPRVRLRCRALSRVLALKRGGGLPPDRRGLVAAPSMARSVLARERPATVAPSPARRHHLGGVSRHRPDGFDRLGRWWRRRG